MPLIAVLCSNPGDVVDLFVDVLAIEPSCEMRIVRDVSELDEVLEDPSLDLLISDVVHDWIHGLEVISKAHAAGIVGGVIIASIVGDEELAADVIRAGALDYVVRWPCSRRLARAVSVGLGLEGPPTTAEHIARTLHLERVKLTSSGL